MKKLLKRLFLLVVALFVSTSAIACDSSEDPVTDDPAVVPPSGDQGGGDNTQSTPVVKPSFTAENFAHGAKSYVAATYEERAEILGILEAYAIKNNLTGLTLKLFKAIFKA